MTNGNTEDWRDLDHAQRAFARGVMRVLTLPLGLLALGFICLAMVIAFTTRDRFTATDAEIRFARITTQHELFQREIDVFEREIARLKDRLRAMERDPPLPPRPSIGDDWYKRFDKDSDVRD